MKILSFMKASRGQYECLLDLSKEHTSQGGGIAKS